MFMPTAGHFTGNNRLVSFFNALDCDLPDQEPSRAPRELELTRDLANRFNSRFGETFVVPEPHIVKATAKYRTAERTTAART